MSLREALRQEIRDELRGEFAQMIQDAVRAELDRRAEETIKTAPTKATPAKKAAAKPEKAAGDDVEF